MKEFSRRSSVCLIDGTFKVVPRCYSQLLTLMGYSESNKKYFPMLYVFLDRKAKDAYSALFTILPKLIDINSFQYVYSDFEKALLNEIEKRLTNKTKLHGCRFHFAQCLLRKFKKICPVIKPQHKALLKFFYGMPFLTTEERASYFQFLINISLDQNLKLLLNTFIKHGK